MYGHKDIRTTRIYCGVKDRALMEYVDRLDIDTTLIDQSKNRTSHEQLCQG